MSSSRQNHHHNSSRIPAQKNLLLSTSSRPLRFALLGPHRSSKSCIVSIISNDKSPENYYPTLQNSLTLIQFQPKSVKARALLDVNVTLDDLEQLGISDSTEFRLTSRVLDSIAECSALVVSSNDDIANTSTAAIMKKSLNYYDLDYTRPDYFDTEMLSGLSPVSSPIATHSVGSSGGNRLNSVFSNGTYFSNVMDPAHGGDSMSSAAGSVCSYTPPVSTPILMELIDTPGVQRNDLIPFLEKGLDSKLASDVLRNLLNEASTESRSRVKPLITGSGMSELNAAMDGYLLCYSCIPETGEKTAPPSYDDAVSGSYGGGTVDGHNNSANNIDDGPPGGDVNGLEAIEILKALYNAIMEAWKQYTTYHIGWQEGQEFDVYSLNYSFKHLWKKRASAKDMSDNIVTKKAHQMLPPILIAATHVDHELASPLLIQKGRELAEEWNCGFIEISCEYENWRNVEEALCFLARDRIEDVKEKRRRTRKDPNL
ncbi:DEKNAAC100456 [Brettanomyces naardenensis]|uniref:DEKNAAC100456 n=1 Tax=Brettanomyces naardenensis TaxID=13370 RepID=A0A448YGH2_BRENA|nr:DEKNAAC100456 [Brettanomyces naardenensis]